MTAEITNARSGLRTRNLERPGGAECMYREGLALASAQKVEIKATASQAGPEQAEGRGSRRACLRQ